MSHLEIAHREYRMTLSYASLLYMYDAYLCSILDEGADNEILKSSDNLEGDEVYQQQYSGRLRSNQPGSGAGGGVGRGGAIAEGGDSSEDEELFMLSGELVCFDQHC